MYASIDVGTNTVRLLLGEVEEGRVAPHTYLRRITRLGGGFSPQTGVSEAAMQRTLGALEEFSAYLEDREVFAVSAVATEALRRAANAPQFVARVRQRTGLELKVVPGSEEARLSSAGVMSILENPPEHLIIFDIGGGSTEFVYVVSGQPVFSKSYPLGTVMLCEHHPGEVAQRAHTDRTLRQLREDLLACGAGYPLPPEVLPVGTAGTVTTLAALDMEMDDYDWRRVNNYVLDRTTLMRLAEQLQPLSVEQRESLPGMEVGRGDLILPGLRITESILDFCACETFTVSDFGLLEGGLLHAAGTL